jgi:hypothetical protein
MKWMNQKIARIFMTMPDSARIAEMRHMDGNLKIAMKCYELMEIIIFSEC